MSLFGDNIPSFKRPYPSAEDYDRYPTVLPVTKSRPPSGPVKMFIVSDTHKGSRFARDVDAYLEGQFAKADIVVLVGDIFEISKSMTSREQARADGVAQMRQWCEKHPGTIFHWVRGNHEDRKFEDQLHQLALELDDHNLHVHGHTATVGPVMFLHGHNITKPQPEQEAGDRNKTEKPPRSSLKRGMTRYVNETVDGLFGERFSPSIKALIAVVTATQIAAKIRPPEKDADRIIEAFHDYMVENGVTHVVYGDSHAAFSGLQRSLNDGTVVTFSNTAVAPLMRPQAFRPLWLELDAERGKVIHLEPLQPFGEAHPIKHWVEDLPKLVGNLLHCPKPADRTLLKARDDATIPGNEITSAGR